MLYVSLTCNSEGGAVCRSVFRIKDYGVGIKFVLLVWIVPSVSFVSDFSSESSALNPEPLALGLFSIALSLLALDQKFRSKRFFFIDPDSFLSAVTSTKKPSIVDAIIEAVQIRNLR
jgi:hypothetical protein